MAIDLRDRFRGCLVGLACGDAVGTTVEFRARGSFAPVTDMIGGGPFHLQPGQWTDDTSMALCLASSLVEKQGFDAHDQMQRYVAWMRDGLWSSTGVCFDIGVTTSTALHRFIEDGDPYAGSTNPRAAGNGSIMRLAPVPMFYYPDHAAAIHHAAESSRTTHAAVECLDACRLFASMICRALDGAAKNDILFGEHAPAGEPWQLAPAIQKIAEGSYRAKTETEIEGSGYVVRSLEAALWCFWNSDDYRKAILMAVNLGDDADTTAAVCGQIAGAHYGLSGIPEPWWAKLAMRDQIIARADQLYESNPHKTS